MSKYDIAVVIGRFQPVHNGHIPAFEKAAELARTTVCVVGSANKPSTSKNPFSVDERIGMISTALYHNKPHPIREPQYVAVEDTFYLEKEWFRRVKKEVALIEEEIREEKAAGYAHALSVMEDEFSEAGLPDKHALDMHLSLHGGQNALSIKILAYRDLLEEIENVRVCVLGHVKDESSYYLKNFANWTLEDIGAWIGDSNNDHPISATDVRDFWFSGKLSFAKSNLAPSTYQELLNWDQGHYEDLREEWEFIQAYKRETQVGPFPVQFLTTDAVVIHGDEILMIRRGLAPGKGQWALPGGFKNEKETFFESCIRELKEETRIKVPEKVLRGSLHEEKMFDFPERSSRGTTVSMVYSFILDASQSRPHVKGGDDAVMAYWFPIDQLLEMRDQIFEDHLDMIEYMTARI